MDFDGAASALCTATNNGAGAATSSQIDQFFVNGTLAWTYLPPVDAVSAICEIAVDSSSHVYFTSYDSLYNHDIHLTKLSKHGALEWQTRVASIGGYVQRVQLATFPTSAFVMYTADPAFGGDLVLAKFNGADGAMMWSKVVINSFYGIQQAFDLAADVARNVVYVATFVGQVAGILAINASHEGGGVLWSTAWPPGDRSSFVIAMPTALAVDPRKGHVYITGTTNSADAHNYDSFIVKYDHTGAYVASRVFGGMRTDIPLTMKLNTFTDQLLIINEESDKEFDDDFAEPAAGAQYALWAFDLDLAPVDTVPLQFDTRHIAVDQYTGSYYLGGYTATASGAKEAPGGAIVFKNTVRGRDGPSLGF